MRAPQDVISSLGLSIIGSFRTRKAIERVTIGAMDVAAVVRQLEASLAAQGTAERARNEKRYLKSELQFLGATVPMVRREAKTFVRAHAELDRKALRALVGALWSTRIHELRSLAIGIMEQRLDLLRAADTAWLIELVRGAGTWAHVDWLATKVIGGVLMREPSSRVKLDRWAKDESFWVRRTALLSLHDALLSGKDGFEHFARLAAGMLGEREFFIRKAIGWVLRSASLEAPALTVGFVEQHAREMSGLSFREAIRRLPQAEQRRLQRLRAG
jgi:3-methyladenine DNA glycosylase AlkD